MKHSLWPHETGSALPMAMQVNADDNIHACLYLWGKSLIPDEVTHLIGTPPTHSRAKDETPPGRSPLRPDLLKLGMWTLSTAQHVSAQTLSDHVAFIVEKVGNKINAMKEQGLIDKARLSLLVHVGESKPGVANWEDELDANLIADVARLGASLALTVMWPLPEDE